MNTEERGISRRAFLTTAGGVALGMGIVRLPGTAHAADALPSLPWTNYYPSAGLDIDAVRKLAYCLNYLPPRGCGYAASQALINALGDELAEDNPDINPWKLLPSGLFAYASGGVLGWGTICGSLNGVLGVMDMLGVHSTLGDALIDYFCNTELPTDILVGWVPADDDDDWTDVPAPESTVATVSHSPLCHNSVSNWAATAGVPLWTLDSTTGKTVPSPQKSKRCAMLVADIVAKAVELMNDKFLNSVIPRAWTVPASYKSCYECHTTAEQVPSEIGRMECQACHDVRPAHSFRKPGKGGRRP